MKELYGAISKQQPLYPQAAFIVVGDFRSNRKTVNPNSVDMHAAPLEDTRLWTMFTPTWRMHTNAYATPLMFPVRECLVLTLGPPYLLNKLYG